MGSNYSSSPIASNNEIISVDVKQEEKPEIQTQCFKNPDMQLQSFCPKVSDYSSYRDSLFKIAKSSDDIEFKEKIVIWGFIENDMWKYILSKKRNF